MRRTLPLFAASALLFSSACGPTGDGDTDAGVELQDVSISFAALVNGEAFDCRASYPRTGTGTTDAVPQDMRLYVHDLFLLNGDGEEVAVELTSDGMWQSDRVALLDFEDGTGTCANGNTEMNDLVIGQAPAGEYTGLRFTVGVPEDINHRDPTGPDTEAPLNLSAMFWNWQGGYKFIRAEVVGGVPWNVHLGSTGCTGDAEVGEVVECMNGNRPTYELTGNDPLQTTVAFDLGALLEGSDLDFNTPDSPAGCMSAPTDPECPAIFDRLGLNTQAQSWVMWRE